VLKYIRTHRWEVFFLGVFLLFAFLILLRWSCSWEIRYSQEVDVTPLYELPVPLKIQSADELAELDIFDQLTPFGYGYRGEWVGGDFYGVRVDMELLADSQTASDTFTGQCEISSFKAQSRFEYGGEGENRYCISYVQEYRASIDSFCSPLGKYVSFVVFQKGNMVIRIWEETKDKDSTAKDDVIALLAEELGK